MVQWKATGLPNKSSKWCLARQAQAAQYRRMTQERLCTHTLGPSSLLTNHTHIHTQASDYDTELPSQVTLSTGQGASPRCEWYGAGMPLQRVRPQQSQLETASAGGLPDLHGRLSWDWQKLCFSFSYYRESFRCSMENEAIRRMPPGRLAVNAGAQLPGTGLNECFRWRELGSAGEATS